MSKKETYLQGGQKNVQKGDLFAHVLGLSNFNQSSNDNLPGYIAVIPFYCIDFVSYPLQCLTRDTKRKQARKRSGSNCCVKVV